MAQRSRRKVVENVRIRKGIIHHIEDSVSLELICGTIDKVWDVVSRPVDLVLDGLMLEVEHER